MEENNTKQVVYQKKEETGKVVYGHNKGLDLFGGFFLGLITFVIPPMILKNYMTDSLSTFIVSLPYVLLMLLVVYFSKKKRKFVVRGIVLFLVSLPIIVFGGCFLLMSSMRGF